ncbi:MAG: hypothetical protein R2873_24045 [Caldilineaceae bacterium]
MNEALEVDLFRPRRTVIIPAPLRYAPTKVSEFIQERLGFLHANARTVESRLAIARMCCSACPTTCPPPERAAINPRWSGRLWRRCAADGRTLVLFTSHAHLRTADARTFAAGSGGA